MSKAAVHNTGSSRIRSQNDFEPGVRVLLTLLSVTLFGTVCNTVVNVPLRDISTDLGVPLPTGVLAVTAFVLVLAAAMPVMGWIGDRFGHTRVLITAQLLLLAGMIGAALAPTMTMLALSRGVQGLGCAAAPPCVRAMLSAVYGPARRTRTMGAWAAANGIGQALGPPLGGLLSQPLGWRGVFWILVPVSALLVAALIAFVPRALPHPSRLHWPGALSFTVGVALLMSAAALGPDGDVPLWAVGVLASTGVASLVLFAVVSRSRVVSRKNIAAFVPPALFVTPRFFRSGVAACAQMFCLGATLVAVPLHVTGALERSTAVAGLLAFALPAAMAALAPVVGRASERVGPRIVLRTGLVTLAAAPCALGAIMTRQVPLLWLTVLLVVIGTGIALVQTPAAAGAARTTQTGAGAALGVFNTLRFGGATLGTAWAGSLYPRGESLVLFVGCGALALLALLISFAGRDPEPV